MSFFKKKSFVFCMLAGVLICIVGILILLALAALLIHKEALGTDYAHILSWVCVALALWIAVPMVTSGRSKQALSLGGSMLGIFVALMLLSRLLLGGEGEFLPWLIGHCGAALLGTLLGIMVSVKKQSRGKRKKKRQVYR